MLAKTLMVTGLALGVGQAALAQDYFDFGQIPGVPDRPAVQIDLDPTLLSLASQTAQSSNAAAAELLSSLDGVRVRVYKSLEDVDDVVAFLDEASSALEKADWRRVVMVQDGSQVRVYVRGDETTVTGVTAMIVGDDEAVFVNVTGTISAEQLAQSIAAMGAGQALASLGAIN